MSILTSNMKVTKIVQKHFLCTFWGFLVTIICDIKIDVNMCEPHYVNLFFLWTSSIVHVFDFLTFYICLTTWHLFDSLTSFWQLDIFLIYGQQDTWAHMGKGVSWVILKIEMGYLGGWGTWVMGHMGNWAHDHNFLNTAWIFTKILLDIDIDVFYLNIQWYSHNGLFKVQKIEGFEILIGSNIVSMNLFHLFQWACMELPLYLCYQLEFLLDFFYWR